MANKNWNFLRKNQPVIILLCYQTLALSSFSIIPIYPSEGTNQISNPILTLPEIFIVRKDNNLQIIRCYNISFVFDSKRKSISLNMKVQTIIKQKKCTYKIQIKIMTRFWRNKNILIKIMLLYKYTASLNNLHKMRGVRNHTYTIIHIYTPCFRLWSCTVDSIGLFWSSLLWHV